jgi:hypothetical protein
MLGCGPNGSCCGKCAGLAGALDLSQDYPRTFNVLKAYVDRKIAAGEPFYLSPEVNSETIGFDGMGFLNAIIAGIGAIAGTAASVAGTAASIKALKGGKASASDADAVAAQIAPLVQQKLAAQGISLPGEVATQVTAAGILDTFGAENRPFVMVGLAGLAALVLLKVMRR